MASPYDIAIHISATNAVSPVLAMISKDMLGLSTSVKKLESAFAGMGTSLKLALGGAVLGTAGYAIETALTGVADKGKELIHQQSIMIRNGLSMAEVYNLTGDAYDRITKAVPTAQASDVLRTISEMRSVTGDTASAVRQSPFALKLDAIMSNIEGKDVEGSGFSIWRALEMKGITASNPGLASQLGETMARIISASAGKVTADTYQSMAKRGGVAWIHASPQFIAGAGSVAAADLGGDTAGTALMSLYQTLSGAVTMTRQQLDVLQKAGIVDMSKVHKVRGSNAMQIDPGAITGSDKYLGDMDLWASKIMAPAFHALADKMAKENHGDSSAIFDSLVAKFGRNRNTSRMLTMFSDPGFLEQIAKDRRIWEQAMGIDNAYSSALGNVGKPMSPQDAADQAGPGAVERRKTDAQRMADYTAVMKAFQAQWDSMLAAMGGPVAQALVPMMKQLTDGFNQMGAMANAHPDAIKNIATALKDLGVVMITVGAAALVMAAPEITAAIAIATAAIYGWQHIPWDSLGAAFDRMKAAGTEVWNALAGFVDRIVSLMNQLRAHVGLPAMGLPAGAPTPWGPAGAVTRESLSYMQGGPMAANLSGIGAPSRAAVMPPPTNVNASLSGAATVTVGNVSINVSGQSIAAAIAGQIEGKIAGLFAGMARTTTGPNFSDGHTVPIYPDHVMHGPH